MKTSSPSAHSRDADRGRDAKSPTEMPKQGWLDIFSRTKQQLDEDNLSIVAAGVAFYGFVAMVPALAATIAIYALVADPATVGQNLETLAKVLPGQAMPLLHEQITRISSDNQAAGWGAILGVAIALFSSAGATKALIAGLNVAYDEEEKRGVIKLNLQAIALTLVAIVVAVLVIGLLAVLPAILGYLGLGEASALWVSLLRWPLLLGLFLFGLACVYRFGPSRDAPKWRWVSPGAGLATVLWLVGSGLFSIYVAKFGGYDKTYGSLGAVVVFLYWLFLTAYVVLLGAELNSESERQTKQDSTEGQSAPLGARRAHAADTVGESRPEATKETKRRA